MKQSTLTAALKGGGILAAIALITRLHYFTDPGRVLLHELFNYLCFIPIIVAAYWFGPWGGLTAALLTSAAFIPHIRMAWASNVPYATSRYSQILVFHLTGLLVGILASYQRQLTVRYRDAANALEVRNQDLLDSQQQLRKAERLSALGEIAAGFVHEVRNPIAAIRGALDIVASKASKNTPEAEFTEIARKELVRLDSLIGDFLVYARPREPALRLTSLSALLERVTVLLRAQAERAQVTVDTRALEQLPSLMLDPDQIAQVFINIALNGHPGESSWQHPAYRRVRHGHPCCHQRHRPRSRHSCGTPRAPVRTVLHDKAPGHWPRLGAVTAHRDGGSRHDRVARRDAVGTIVRVTLPISPTRSAAQA